MNKRLANLTINLKKELDAYNARWVAGGGKLTAWTCPHCAQPSDTPRPRRSDVTSKGYWDSMRMCAHCGKLSFVTVYPSGKTIEVAA